MHQIYLLISLSTVRAILDAHRLLSTSSEEMKQTVVLVDRSVRKNVRLESLTQLPQLKR